MRGESPLSNCGQAGKLPGLRILSPTGRGNCLTLLLPANLTTNGKPERIGDQRALL